MFWSIMLAHLLADYPLQTDRMVLAKKHLPGLTIHALVHLVAMAILAIPELGVAWPYLVTIAVLHFFIDYLKNMIGRHRPDLVISPYILDQFLHISSMLLVAFVMDMRTDLVVWYAWSSWWAIAIGFVIVSYITFISERIIVYSDGALQAKVQKTMWLRMTIRSLIFISLVISPPASFILSLIGILIMVFFYRRRLYPTYWLILDPIIGISAAILVFAIPVL